jgi:DNA-directed RNA polymerase specialized sigma24 family protein
MKFPSYVELWFVELYKTEHDRVFQIVYALCGDAATAEDATQEAFVRALERWDRLRDQPWAAGWVTTTAVNMARRMLRRRRWLFGTGPTEVDLVADGALDGRVPSSGVGEDLRMHPWDLLCGCGE